jgi:hypothetical protein
MPVAWTRIYTNDFADSRAGSVFTTTMGASQDFEFEGTRRMIVNGCFWAIDLEAKIPDKTNVDIVGTFKPTRFYFKKSEEWVKEAVKPADYFK